MKREKESDEGGGVDGDEGLCKREGMRQKSQGLGVGSRPR